MGVRLGFEYGDFGEEQKELELWWRFGGKWNRIKNNLDFAPSWSLTHSNESAQKRDLEIDLDFIPKWFLTPSQQINMNRDLEMLPSYYAKQKDLL